MPVAKTFSLRENNKDSLNGPDSPIAFIATHDLPVGRAEQAFVSPVNVSSRAPIGFLPTTQNDFLPSGYWLMRVPWAKEESIPTSIASA